MVPFLIDWGDTPHPTTRGLPTVALRAFTLVHPDAERIRRTLAALELTTGIVDGPEPGLVAVLDSPRGPVTI